GPRSAVTLASAATFLKFASLSTGWMGICRSRLRTQDYPMTTNELNVGRGADQMAHVEALLACYPNISEGDLQVLKSWFKREASALDVAMLASEAEINSGYRQFRADHIDKFNSRDITI